MMSNEDKLIELLRLASARWIAMGHQDIWDSDDFTDNLGNFCNRVSDRLASGSLADADKEKLWGIFAPTCAWDDSVGDSALGNRIFALIDKLYRKNVLALG